jgi:hypothetical protein
MEIDCIKHGKVEALVNMDGEVICCLCLDDILLDNQKNDDCPKGDATE